jgi:hypothetical protein
MKNQKAAQVLAVQSAFVALQTSDGCALFFGIGDTGVLYASREQTDVSTGWTPLDVTTGIRAACSAKAFAASQNASTGDVIIAQIVTDGDGDHLMVATGLSNDPQAAWLGDATLIPWNELTYDDMAAMIGLAFVSLASYHDTDAMPYVIAGATIAPTNTIKTYFVAIDSGVTHRWKPYPTQVSYDHVLGLDIGQSTSSDYWGLYLLYGMTDEDEQQVAFFPYRSLNDGPTVITILPITSPSAIAALPSTSSPGYTDLYVARAGSISVFPAEQQTGSGTPSTILSSPVIATVDTMQLRQSNGLSTLWGRNTDGSVFCSRYDASAASPAWSTPIVIATNVQQLTSMIDCETGATTLFAHCGSQNVLKLTQDPLTTLWRQLSILLPPVAITDVYETYTYTTHLAILDANNLPLLQTQSAAVSIPLCASSPVDVYVNGLYVKLSNAAPIAIAPAEDGTITIMQEVQTLACVTYTVTQGDGSTVAVDPLAGPMSCLRNVHSGADLSVNVSDEQGNQTPLLPTSVTDDQKTALANTVAKCVQLADQSSGVGAADALSLSSFGLSFLEGAFEEISVGGDLSGAVLATTGDVLTWLVTTNPDIDQFFVSIDEDAAHLFITIGEAIYDCVLSTAADIVHGIQFVFAKLGAFFETLVRWLGFIFDWNDIKTTHLVLKNFVTCFVNCSIAQLGSVTSTINQYEQDIKDCINSWGGIAPADQTVADVTSANGVPNGQGHPAAHWALHQLRSNAAGGTATNLPGDPQTSGIDDALTNVSNWVDDSTTAFGDVTTQLQTLASSIGTSSPTEILKQLVATIADLVLNVITDVLDDIVTILQSVAQTVFTALNAPVSIPVISSLYQEFVGDDLTALDLACLVAAIPATILCKVIGGVTPFPTDDPTTALLQNAPDLATIRSVFANSANERAAALVSSSTWSVPPLDTPGERWNFAANFVVWFAGGALSCCAVLKGLAPNSGLLYAITAVVYVPYCSADFGIETPQTWDAIMNEVVTGISILKGFADIALYRAPAELPSTITSFPEFMKKCSPFIGAVISIVWMVPIVPPLVRDQSPPSIVEYIANVSFNCTDIIGVASAPVFKLAPPALETVMLICAVTVAIYGDGMIISSFLTDDA